MIRRFFAFLWRLLTFPFRLVARPFRALASAISQEPEDTPAVEAFSRTLENPFLLLEHLEALRGNFLR